MLAILTTHPIQYQVPLWREIARDGRIPFQVWYLTKHGIDVSYHPAFGKSFAWDLDLLSAYPHRFLATPPDASPDLFWKCRAAENLGAKMQAEKVMVVWVNGWDVFGYWQAVWAAKKVGVKVWLRGESNDLAQTPLWKRVIKRIVLGQLFRRVDRFLCIGAGNRRLYEKFGIPSDKLYPAPYAVDNERFAAQANEIRGQRSEIRREWNIPQDAFCALFCGKFITKKRPSDLIAAAQQLITDNRLFSIHLLFVGSGELGPKLRAHCKVVFDQENSPPTSDLRPPISDPKPPASFAGFLNQTEISRAYVAADCLVLPSDHRETWGLVVNEAMASGLPCVISNQCGCAADLGAVGANQTFACRKTSELGNIIQRLALDQNGPVCFAMLPSLKETAATALSLYANLFSSESQT
jgi:glycosyltransferase involved in cell wall biosynthesis